MILTMSEKSTSPSSPKFKTKSKLTSKSSQKKEEKWLLGEGGGGGELWGKRGEDSMTKTGQAWRPPSVRCGQKDRRGFGLMKEKKNLTRPCAMVSPTRQTRPGKKGKIPKKNGNLLSGEAWNFLRVLSFFFASGGRPKLGSGGTVLSCGRTPLEQARGGGGLPRMH